MTTTDGRALASISAADATITTAITVAATGVTSRVVEFAKPAVDHPRPAFAFVFVHTPDLLRTRLRQSVGTPPIQDRY
jgi:hypothetical protein